MRLPLTECRSDHRAGINLAAVDTDRAAEAAADIESCLNHRISRVGRLHRYRLRVRRGRTGSKYVTFRGGLRRAIPYPSLGQAR